MTKKTGFPILTPMTKPIAEFLLETFPKKTLEECEDLAFYICFNILNADYGEDDTFVVSPIKHYKLPPYPTWPN